MQLQKISIKENKIINIVFAGVGGQGVLMASDVLGEVALRANFDVKKSEIHGMAQRGGSVISQVRFGEKIHSPVIKQGSAEILISFEELETVRYIDYVKPNGYIIFNTEKIIPLSVYFSDSVYPENVYQLCKQRVEHIFSINAIEEAEKLENSRTVNTIILGALSNLLEFENNLWLDVIKSRVPAKTVDLNIQAFETGKTLIKLK